MPVSAGDRKELVADIDHNSWKDVLIIRKKSHIVQQDVSLISTVPPDDNPAIKLGGNPATEGPRNNN